MTNFDALCKAAEDIPADIYREVLREKARIVLPALEAAAGSRERAETIFAAFIIASVYADGTLDEAEYMLLLPHLREAFGEGFGFDEVKAVIETSKKEGKTVIDFADALCDWFGVLSEELKDELVLLSLLLCAVDGKVSKKERKYIRRLIREILAEGVE